ncbi:MAG: DUF4173 domain-containing protein [Gemmatimonadetes bacterium]|nr:DUF4173 domain-containing protein [Gemmatimonadota bacterium]
MPHPPSDLATAPESAAPSPRALVARRVLQGGVLLGVLADPLLRNEQWGLGLLVWMVAFAVIATLIVHQNRRPLSLESRLWLAVAVCSAAGLSWRGADLLQFFDVLAMLAALVLLAMSINAVPVAGLALARVRDLIQAAFGTGVDVATGAFALLVRDAELHTARRPTNDGRVWRIGRAVLITAPILFVFTLLLAHTDVTLALGALNVLFGAFVVVQIGWLFGGEALVLRTTGLSYAEYARRGFFELMGVAGLLLPVLLGAQALIPATDVRTLRFYRRLALPLVVLLGAIMGSAGARMQLYVQYYGISTDRLYAMAVMIWLAIVFVWFTVTVLRSRPGSFATGLVVSGFAALFTLNVLNPDALVARANLARGEAGRTGAAGADLRYVASLGGDAVPMLLSALTAPGVAAGTAVPRDRCVAAAILLNRWTGERRAWMVSNWTQWNSARRHAALAVRANQAALQRLACPDSGRGAYSGR